MPEATFAQPDPRCTVIDDMRRDLDAKRGEINVAMARVMDGELGARLTLKRLEIEAEDLQDQLAHAVKARPVITEEMVAKMDCPFPHSETDL